MNTFPRALKVNKTDAFAIDVSLWLGADTVDFFSVDDKSEGKVIIGDTSIDSSCLKVLLTGVDVGTAEIHFNYNTSNRSDCFTVFVNVTEDC
tara:strand:+ start:21355 stop:21630 length:276 start_codon:yes stop_codon:yes gene_type:complete